MENSNTTQPKKENNSTKEKNGNKGMWISALIVLLLLGIGAAGYFTGIIPEGFLNRSNSQSSKTVAVVNDESISEKELEVRIQQMEAQSQTENEVSKEQKKQILQQMIDEELIYQKAKEKGITVDGEEIDSRYQEIKNGFEDSTKFEQTLKESNLSKEDFRSNIERDIILNKYTDLLKNERDLNVSEEEVQAFYDQNVSTQENAPQLEEVETQIKQYVIQQKLAKVLNEILEEIKKEADTKILL